MDEKIPDKNLFMMCERANEVAFSALPPGYAVRAIRKNELALWMAMPFDDAQLAEANLGFMTRFFEDVYAGEGDLFFRKCLFVCDEADTPIATCFAWKAYGFITTLHWLKVLPPYEGRGIGRALLSIVMKGIDPEDYPVYLHTQPGSYRAIKLYADFGFAFLTDPVVGYRDNHLEECLPLLKQCMPGEHFARLRTAKAPAGFLAAVKASTIDQF